MKKGNYINQVQVEALLNEFKGNLFEFLVAQVLARKSNLEDKFLIELPHGFKLQLGSYEHLIRQHEPNLLRQLPALANQTAESVWSELNLESLHFYQWSVLGKVMSSNDSQVWNETDVVGLYKNESGEIDKISLSLKLSKEHSFVNTKSAGVKSFLSKYFAYENHTYQSELNTEVDESFHKMGFQLYDLAGLDWKGQFNSDWTDQFSELPGDLSDEMREIVHAHYFRIVKRCDFYLRKLKENNSELFVKSLATLCGFGHLDIIQVNCFHQDYQMKKISLKNYHELFKSDDKCDILPLKNFSSSFEIQMGKLTLQIRVKPMNKFTTAAYKMNCSIKVRDE